MNKLINIDSLRSQLEDKKMLFNSIIKNVESILDLNIVDIKKMPLQELRTRIEDINKGKTKFYSEAPLFGRGNVLRDRLITSEEINKDVDAILNSN